MTKNQSASFTDTPLYKLTNAIYRWFAVSMLWVLCSIPLITIGAATASAMGEFSDPENCEGHGLVRDYFRRFHSCFFRGTALWVLFVLLIGLLVLDLSFYRQLTGSTGWVLPGAAGILGNLLLCFFRFCCFTAAHGRTGGFRALLRQGGRTMLLCLPVCALMVAMDLVGVTTMVKIPCLLVMLLVLPGFYADMHCRLIQMFLRRYESEEK